MCGVAGGLSLDGSPPLDASTLANMLAALDHRGPEGAGVWRGPGVVLGHARLAIVDLAGGLQPIANEDGSIWLVVNGEVFNHDELRSELELAGHRFRSRSDSEVIVHLYEELGPRCVERLNGQFAFALWDGRRRRLLLGRDPLGVRPLFYTTVDDQLLFASEIKALLVDRRVPRRPDPIALDHLFTYWSPIGARTMFDGISQLPAGHLLEVDLARGARRQPVLTRYWTPTFAPSPVSSADDAADELRARLDRATRRRLRADVPVGAYLSGGLDSSVIAALAAQVTPSLQTFSVAFDDQGYDERGFQQEVATRLGTEHHVIDCGGRQIADAFPEVVWHAETPLLRTAPAPLFLLSDLVRRNGLKVVLTGEGADELFAGYDIFKEALVRRFWARDPSSTARPQLLERLYDSVPGLHRGAPALRQAFFKQGLSDVDDPFFSHRLRWRSTARLKRLLSAELRDDPSVVEGRRRDVDDLLALGLERCDALSRAQHLEIGTFLTPYLLSSQGDRVAMAHSVEGRFPFLDPEVVSFALSLPPHLRLVGLREKHLLKRAFRDLVPPSIVDRTKQPYRAPVAAAFTGPDAPEYVRDLLRPEEVLAAGLFDPVAVSALSAKAQSNVGLTEMDEMALVGVVSGQLWHARFIAACRAGSTASPPKQIVELHAGDGGGDRLGRQAFAAAAG